MKIIILAITFTFSLLVHSKAQEEPALEENYMRFEAEISAFRLQGKEGLSDLGRSLRYFGKYISSNAEPQDQRCYQLAQDAILSIPGHADFFVKQLETLRTTGDYEKILTYHSDRRRYIADTFIHMPSPETVKALGNYLDDFRDTQNPNLPLDKQIILAQGANQFERANNAPNAWLATFALSKINLRGINFEGMRISNSPNNDRDTDTSYWRKARIWYKEVESGQRTFSFKGKNVEYRFKPDGTWDSTTIANPANDAIIYPTVEAMQNKAKREAAELAANTAQQAKPLLWKWITGALLIVAISIVRLVKQRRYSKLKKLENSP